MQIIWVLFGFLFSFSISIPFVNQFLNGILNLNFSFIYILSICFSVAIFLLQFKVSLNIYHLVCFVFLVVAFFMNIGSSLTNGFYSVLIGFLLCLPFLQNKLSTAFLRAFFVTFMLFSSLFFFLIVTDPRVSDVIFLRSRMAMDNSPISIAIFAGISLLISLSFLRQQKQLANITSLVLLFMSIFFVAVILFSGSRGPLLAIFFILFFQMIRSGNIVKTFLLVIVSSLGALFVLSSRGNSEASSSSRVELYKEAVNIASESPLGGFQIGKYEMLTGKPFPHNLFLEVWVDLNVFFLLMFSFLTLYVVYQRYVVLFDKINFKRSLLVDIFVLVFLCCQFSLPSVEMLRVLMPMLFLSLCCVYISKDRVYEKRVI
ncbi:O-antigen ligase family protein [Shewanella algae]|uniref:O-antigen ligase family protein n=1 Tax=Shewanella algae TaxID=38313 RepID=UPI001AAF2C21|nr:O-antigen ligase family protein [Shewanella algae]MBO2581711.1 hypothetical protein [Shewanella algae]